MTRASAGAGLAAALFLLAVAPAIAIAQDTGLTAEERVEQMSRDMEQSLGPGLVLGGCTPFACSGFTVFALGGAIATWFYRANRRGLSEAGEAVTEIGNALLNREPKRPTPVPRTPVKAPPRPKFRGAQAWNEGVLERAGKNDPYFSPSGVLDFVLVLHRAATTAACSDEWSDLMPFVTPMARAALTTAHRDIHEIRMLAVDAIQVQDVEVEAMWTRFTLKIRSIRHELAHAGEQLAWVEEKWTMRRAAQARSLPPEDAMRLACPSCGAPVAVTRSGECQHCSRGTCLGQYQWQIEDVSFYPRQPVPSPTFDFTRPDPEDPGTHTAAEPLSDFLQRHPGFDLEGFFRFASDAFVQIRTHIDAGDWAGLRPLVTDMTLNQLLFDAAQHTEHGVWHHRQQIEVTGSNLARIDFDGIYEHLTVWIGGRRVDFVADETGAVIEGSANVPRPFGERWVFRRMQGTDMGVQPVGRCPACGVGAQHIDEAGTCASCGAWVTSGEHGWVVTRIEKPEVS